MLSRKSFGLLLVLALAWTNSALAQDAVDAGAPPPPPDGDAGPGPGPDLTGQCVAMWGPCDINHPACVRGQCTPQGCVEITPNECRDSQECMTGNIALCGAFAGQCTNIGQCPSGFDCNANMCTMVLGQPHPGNNNDGGPNQGGGFSCQPDWPECQRCNGDADCPAGEYCPNGACNPRSCVGNAECGPNATCSKGLCVPGGSAQCIGDAECAPNGHCVNGTCSFGGPGAQCIGDAECGPNNHCVNGICNPTQQQCMDNSQCPSGGQCIGGVCNFRQAQCAGDAECGQNGHCLSGTCTYTDPCKDGSCNNQCMNGNCGPTGNGQNSGSNDNNKGPQISCSVTPGTEQSAWSGLGFLLALSMLIARRARRS